MEIQKKWFSEDTPKNAVAATADIGSGDNGTVTITYGDLGAEGNNAEVAVEIATTEDADLSVSYSSDLLTVTLGTDTYTDATAVFGSGDNGTVTVTAGVDGAAGNSYTHEAVVAGEVDTDMSVDFTDGALVVTLGTDGVGDPDDTKNTATLIAAAIDALDGLSAVASGTGVTAIDSAEAEAAFSGGVDFSADDTKNTATLIAAAIDALDDLSAEASGTGATAISSATESNVAFTGGVDGTKAPIPYTWLYIDSTYYVNIAPNGVDGQNWRTVTFTQF